MMESVGYDSITVRRKLGEALKQARGDAGMGTIAAAAAVGVNQSTLSRMENAKLPVSPLMIARLAQTYGVSDEVHQTWQRMLQDVQNGDRWWDAYDQWLSPKYAELIEIENEASSLITMAPDLVPGLLQSADYTRALFCNAPPIRADPESIEALMEVRRLRQRRLNDANPIKLHVILGEAALYCRYGSSTAVHHEQLLALLTQADHPQVDIRIIPFASMIQMSPVDLYDFAEGMVSVVYSESVISKVPVEHTHALTVPSTRDYLKYAYEHALPFQESTRLIKRAIGALQ